MGGKFVRLAVDDLFKIGNHNECRRRNSHGSFGSVITGAANHELDGGIHIRGDQLRVGMGSRPNTEHLVGETLPYPFDPAEIQSHRAESLQPSTQPFRLGTRDKPNAALQELYDLVSPGELEIFGELVEQARERLFLLRGNTSSRAFDYQLARLHQIPKMTVDRLTRHLGLSGDLAVSYRLLGDKQVVDNLVYTFLFHALIVNHDH